MQIVIKMLHGGAGGGSVFFLHARSVVGPPEVRFAHPVRLPPDTHSQGLGRPCLRRPHHRPGFYVFDWHNFIEIITRLETYIPSQILCFASG